MGGGEEGLWHVIAGAEMHADVYSSTSPSWTSPRSHARPAAADTRATAPLTTLAAAGCAAYGRLQMLAWQVLRLLSQHTAKAEEVLVPEIRRRLGECVLSIWS